MTFHYTLLSASQFRTLLLVGRNSLFCLVDADGKGRLRAPPWSWGFGPFSKHPLQSPVAAVPEVQGAFPAPASSAPVAAARCCRTRSLWCLQTVPYRHRTYPQALLRLAPS
ncbi:hypothetical protein EVAR_63622_1 [Eumeta japonica]|uniref:Uncharacterized protein n=1 Tax=Eumeta variegata TaxID=151549 RepID=A0A4C1ZU91_EUMVA|nr:hypothetical protein EVAR_63622_1 [Eumeta japonica]